MSDAAQAGQGSGQGDAGQLKPTSAVQMRAPRESGFTKLLPSGVIVVLRPVNLETLLFNGDIPDLLTSVVVRMVDQGFDAMTSTQINKAIQSDNIEDRKAARDLFKTICKAAFLSPRIVDEDPKDEEILYEDLDGGDAGFVFAIATRGVAVLRHFRYEPALDVEDIPVDADEPLPTEPAAELVE